MKTYRGRLTWDIAPDCEGIVWIMETRNKSIGYQGTIFLKRGDYLTIFDENNNIIFKGEIELDFESGRDPEKGRQKALGGIWIHWVQKGWTADEWTRLFVRKRGQPDLEAELTTDRKV